MIRFMIIEHRKPDSNLLNRRVDTLIVPWSNREIVNRALLWASHPDAETVRFIDGVDDGDIVVREYTAEETQTMLKKHITLRWTSK